MDMRNHTALTLTIVAAFLLVPLRALPQIYKWVDEQGKTIYSSTPPPAGVKNPVVVPIAPSPEPPPVSAKPDSAKPAAKPGTPKPSPEVSYTSVQLTSPTPEETIRSNTGEVPFSIALQPPLQQGHKVRVLVNGSAYGELEASQGTLSSLERGGYTLQAEIIDRSGRAVASTNSVTFYLHQASAQSPIQKKKGK